MARDAARAAGARSWEVAIAMAAVDAFERGEKAERERLGLERVDEDGRVGVGAGVLVAPVEGYEHVSLLGS
jgi:hypothetical protein